MGMGLILTRQGIASDLLRRDGPTPERPADSAALLQYWHHTLASIADDYTFGDLVSLLRDVDDIENVSPLLACDVRSFLTEADRDRQRQEEESIDYVEVRNLAELTQYEPDPAHPDEPLHWMDEEEAAEQDRIDDGISALTGETKPLKVVDATGDDPITGTPRLRRLKVPASHGRWTPPYEVTREFQGRGRGTDGQPATFALDFSPLSVLLHLPLRYDPKMRFCSDRGSGVDKVMFETEVTITFGEFLHAIFGELGFHGSPADRDEIRAHMLERADTIDRLRKA